MCRRSVNNYLSFFHDPATTEIYTLSLHDALPIFGPHERRRREQHDAHFKHFCPDGHGALAESVRQIPTHEREENEGGGEQHANEQFHLIALRLVFFDRKNQVDDQKFQRILVEGALELRGDQTPESEPPLLFWDRHENAFVGHHARSPSAAIRTQEMQLV